MKNDCPEYYKVDVITRKGVVTVECTDLINALIEKNNFNHYSAYLYGTLIGYVFRCGSKEDLIRDLRKARNYIDQLIDECVGNAYDTDTETD